MVIASVEWCSHGLRFLGTWAASSLKVAIWLLQFQPSFPTDAKHYNLTVPFAKILLCPFPSPILSVWPLWFRSWYLQALLSAGRRNCRKISRIMIFLRSCRKSDTPQHHKTPLANTLCRPEGLHRWVHLVKGSSDLPKSVILICLT